MEFTMSTKNRKNIFKNSYVNSVKDYQDNEYLVENKVSHFWWDTNRDYVAHSTLVEKSVAEEINEETTRPWSADHKVDAFCHEIKTLLKTTEEDEFRLAKYSKLQYINPDDMEYYLRGVDEVDDLPQWFVMARLAGLTPGHLVNAFGLPKKTAKRIFNQSIINWPYLVHSLQWAKFDFLQEFNERYAEVTSPKELETILKSLVKECQDILVKMFINNTELFYREEHVREGEFSFYRDSYLVRIAKALEGQQGISFKSTNVKSITEELEDLLVSDVEYETPFTKSPNISVITTSAKKIKEVGRKMRNCLVQREESVSTRCVVLFESRHVAELKFNRESDGSWSEEVYVEDHQGFANEATTGEQQDELQRFVTSHGFDISW
jgi:hypothetical protein